VVGHSWGCDLAVRYAVDHPEAVTAVVGIGGRGPQRDRTWSEVYEAGKAAGPVVDIDWVPEVHAALGDSFTGWIHRPRLWRGLAACGVPMHFIAAGDDIRPSLPLAQLAELIPRGRFSIVSGVHDFWFTHPEVWTKTVTNACTTS
jgi:proline iminopeptidase